MSPHSAIESIPSPLYWASRHAFLTYRRSKVSIPRNPTMAAQVGTASQSSPHSYDVCLYRLIASQADQTPDAIAIVAPGGAPLTYSRLRSQVEHIVTILNAMGIGRNDRVAMVLPNGPEAAVAFLGVAAGATCAPLNPQLRASEFEFFLTHLQAKVLVVQSGSDSPARAVAQKYGIPVI